MSTTQQSATRAAPAGANPAGGNPGANGANQAPFQSASLYVGDLNSDVTEVRFMCVLEVPASLLPLILGFAV